MGPMAEPVILTAEHHLHEHRIRHVRALAESKENAERLAAELEQMQAYVAAYEASIASIDKALAKLKA